MPAIESVESAVVVETPAVKKAKIDDEAEVVTSDAAVVAAVTAPTAVPVEEKAAKPTLRFAKLSEHAKAPTRGSSVAAGYDLYAAEEMVIEPGKRACVKVRTCVGSSTENPQHVFFISIKFISTPSFKFGKF